MRELEEVSSVVSGDPGAFKAEHSEAELQLVFFKATTTKPPKPTLRLLKGGREISLSLTSQGKSDQSEVVDYVLNCERPHRFLITSGHSSFVVGDTKSIAPQDLATSNPPEKPGAGQGEQVRKVGQIENPHGEGKLLRVATGETTEEGQQMAVSFAVASASRRTIEVLPP